MYSCIKLFYNFSRVITLLLLLSCASTDEVYLYDRTEFVPVRQPSYTRPTIDPYYQHPKPYNPYNSMPPNSRAYSNPYDFQPQGYYPYYDNERYYVAPSYYRNVEPVNNSMGSMKY